MGCRKVLLLGNGINRSFSSETWDDIIRNMAMEMNSESVLAKKGYESSLPLPLQAVVASKNKIDDYMKNNKKRFYGKVMDDGFRNRLQMILEAGFDDILTTNYSYELEIAATDKTEVSDYYLNKIRRTTKKDRKAEGRLFVYTYNEVTYKHVRNRIWHIHGAAKNPSSMVIGHPYYGDLISKYDDYLKSVGNGYVLNPDLDNSWIDSFIMGEVYTLGLSLDPSEMDLWWLIDRKRRAKLKNGEKMKYGGVHYYAPKWEHEENIEKYELMKWYDVDKVEIGNKGDKSWGDKDYKRYYEEVLKSIVSISKG